MHNTGVTLETQTVDAMWCHDLIHFKQLICKKTRESAEINGLMCGSQEDSRMSAIGPSNLFNYYYDHNPYGPTRCA